jgi:hypothetical protein
MRVRRPVRVEKLYRESRKALGSSPQTRRAAQVLAARVTNYPETAGTLLPDGTIRVAKGYLYRDFPQMRLFYWIDDDEDGTIHLLYLERLEERPQ